jgi:hypothetical protein
LRPCALILVAEDQSPLFQIIGRYFYRHAIPSQRLDSVLFHSPGCVGYQLVSVIELNAITGIGQNFCYETLEFQKFFFCHVIFLLNGRPNVAVVTGGRAPIELCHS